MPGRRRDILLLGGTYEARLLAAELAEQAIGVVTSLAGVTSEAAPVAGPVRTGGFGGAEGLAAHLEEGGYAGVIDATHPFAAGMSANAVTAAKATGVPLVRLERPPWSPGPGDDWRQVASLEAAVQAIPRGACVLVTIGRKGLCLFARRRDISLIARAIEAPGFTLPDNWRMVLARPPFALEDEVALMREEAVDVLVAKNAGGRAGSAKIAAARQLGVSVIMVARPALATAPTVTTVAEAVIWARRIIAS